MKKKERLIKVFDSKKGRTHAIGSLHKQGFNYFVVYNDKCGKPALQWAKSNSQWVLSKCKYGIFVSGN